MLSGILLAATLPLALPPFSFAGRITDYAHIGYDAETVVEIRVKNQAGDLLAKTTTATSGKTAYNYRVDIPVANAVVSGYAQPGETVVFEFVDPYGVLYAGLVSAADATLGKPGELKRLDVVLATDSDHDGIADEYLETVAYEMWMRGIEGDYDADADYDGDGVSNRDEYLAGTNPFDATDKFTVREMAIDDGISGYIALRVPVNQGRSYSVKTTAALESGDWQKTTFVEDAASGTEKTYLSTGPTEVGYKTIFVKREGPQRFWKLNVE